MNQIFQNQLNGELELQRDLIENWDIQPPEVMRAWEQTWREHWYRRKITSLYEENLALIREMVAGNVKSTSGPRLHNDGCGDPNCEWCKVKT